MLTLENTNFFSQEQLDEMNEEVRRHIQDEIDNSFDPSFVATEEDIEVFEDYWDVVVLAKWMKEGRFDVNLKEVMSK